jgi:hypothetical protein
MILVIAMIVAGVLELAAAGDLVFTRRAWETTRRVCAWSALVLLLGSMGMLFGMPGSAPHQAIWLVAGAAVTSFACALFTGGRFRWIALSAAVIWMVAIFPIVAFLGSSQGVR